MLRRVRHSIRAKVMLVVLATTLVALLITGTMLVIYDLRTHEASWVDDMVTQAEIVGRASATSLTFGDTLAAHQNLWLLSARPQIAAAAIYSIDGRLFATYRRDSSSTIAFPPPPDYSTHRIEHGRLLLFETVADADERLGTMCLVAQYDLRERLLNYLAIVLLVLVCSLAVAFLLSYLLQDTVTRPILAIAEVARSVKQRRDFSLRAHRTSDDETGDLVTAFNDMLGEVGHRTEALEGTNRRLEHEMEVREEAETALRLANQRKDEFLATLAHELRNPLGPIRNATHYLRLRGELEPEMKRTLEIVDRQVKHMVRLIEDLLDISRITRDVLELRLSTFPLSELLQDVIESSQHAIDEAGHRLTVLAPDQPVALHADRARLAQAITNMLNNAIKYTPQGGRIELAVEVHGPELVLTLTDSGIGIPPDRLADIFQPFSQVDRSLEKTRGGLGIGLALSQRLVALHGGTVTAASDGPGTGSRFQARLPVVTTALAPAQGGEEPIEPARERLRVLVADDNPDAAASLALLLRACGYDPVTAPDGETALGLAETRGFDAAILDIGMPRLNGYEVARRIRTQPWGRTMLLVALTGWGQAEDKARASAAGFDEHMTKPVHPNSLIETLERGRTASATRGHERAAD